MKTRLVILTLAATLFVITAAISGCGGKGATLESIVAGNPEIQEKIEKTLSAIENDEMSVDVSFSENTATITGNLKKTYDEAKVEEYKKALEDGSIETNGSFKEGIDQIETLSKVPGVKINLVINNGDGSTIWEKEYE